MSSVYVAGGGQSDFALNWRKQQTGIEEQLSLVVRQGCDDMGLPLSAVDSVVVGNFAGELFIDQGLLNGLVVQAIPEFYGKPSMRTEAACASGSIAILNAMAQIQAGWTDIVCVIGVEQMRHHPAQTTAQYLGTAIHHGQECENVAFPWPHLFGRLGEVYQQRYGLDEAHLTYLSQLAFRNSARNPLAQTRHWDMPANKFSRHSTDNPQIDGMICRTDCAQITDGVTMLVLASDKAIANGVLKHLGSRVTRISGFGSTTAPINMQTKLEHASEYVFPHVRSAVTQAYQQAGVTSIDQIDLWETHDCFSTTFYMALDHLGITPPGENYRAIEQHWLDIDGKTPVNPSGGLIGVGHPVGATGVRQMLDCHRQLCGQADGYQVAGANRACMLNLGGSATSAACFVTEAVNF